MNKTESLRSRILSGQPLTGIWQFSPSPVFSEMTRFFGLDFVVVDLEHGAIGIGDVVEILRAVSGGRTKVLVRVPSHDPTMVSRVLDRGADGVIIPRVDDPVTAAKMAAAARFPPLGERGLALRALRASEYGVNVNYRRQSDEDVLVVVQLESGTALKNALAIAAAPGVDMVFIGPSDLAANLGLEGAVHEVALGRAIDETMQILTGAAIPVGTIPHAGRNVKELIGLGYRLVVHDSDINIMREGLAQYCKAINHSFART